MRLPTTLLLCASFALAACTATDERPMNAGEATVASPEVAQRVEEAGGAVDTREQDDLVCKRVRKTGSHRVTRVCYTRAEEEALTRSTQEEVRRSYGGQRCLDRTRCTGG